MIWPSWGASGATLYLKTYAKSVAQAANGSPIQAGSCSCKPRAARRVLRALACRCESARACRQLKHAELTCRSLCRSTQAENELSLTKSMLKWKPWESLEEEPSLDQWKFP